eukprot:1962506-Prymnesium_polylepis.1
MFCARRWSVFGAGQRRARVSRTRRWRVSRGVAACARVVLERAARTPPWPATRRGCRGPCRRWCGTRPPRHARSGSAASGRSSRAASARRTCRNGDAHRRSIGCECALKGPRFESQVEVGGAGPAAQIANVRVAGG